MKNYQFPFSAIIADKMKLALILNIIDPKIGGVLLTGHQGTGKSTAVRALVDVLPSITVKKGCQFNCDVTDDENFCEFCANNKKEKFIKNKINLVNLPLGSSQDMVIGTLDLEKIIRDGKKAIQPGLLAKAHRGILYIDEINLLQDHLVDILLDVAASGINIIEREGISLSHPSEFILVGSMNPEEGDLRPQISDRLGLEVKIRAPKDPKIRAKISQRVVNFQDNPKKFCQNYKSQQKSLQNQIISAKKLVSIIPIPNDLYVKTADLTLKLGLSSQRADITFIRCARAHAAFEDRKNITQRDLKQSLKLAFEHRLANNELGISSEEILDVFNEVFSKEGEKK